MTSEIDVPAGGWKTLQHIYRHYLSQTPTEDGETVAELLRRCEVKERYKKVVMEVCDLSKPLQQEQIKAVEQLEEKSVRMRSVVAHIMVKEAAAGIWFALGRRDGKGQHDLIPPASWRFLLLDVDKGAAGRGNFRFEDLLCAFTKDATQPGLISRMGKANPDALRDSGFDSTDGDPSWREVRLDKNGGAGRPSGMHLVLEEMRRRQAKALLKPTLAAETRDLAEWFKRRHPAIRPLTPKAIANSLRDDYRGAKASREAERPKLSTR